ncbi:unnamed protein product [Ectocarpus fasciculatus]
MPRRPPGLKLYPQLLTGDALDALRAHCRALPPPPSNPLFRYFGDFGENARTEPVRPWMLDMGRDMLARGFFSELPNQYRVTRWDGTLAAQFKWHTDNRRHGEEILVISLTDRRAIGWRPRADSPEPYVLRLEAGDGYLIRGSARWQWQHRVMPVGHQRSGGESFVIAYRR